MHATSPSSIFTSLMLHAAVAAIIFLATIYVARSDKIQPAIIELVAGPPTAPDELVAPALGNTTAPVKMTVPKIEIPADPEPQVEQTQAVPEPPVQETVKTQPEPVKPAKAEPVKPTPKPKADTSISKQVNKSVKTSYQEYLKKHPTPKPTVASTSRSTGKPVPKIDAQGIANGVRGGSTANTRGGGGGKAMTREEADQLSTYISFLLQELKNAHEPPPGVSDQLQTKVTFDITASGAILNPRISKSSGNREFDESVLDAFRRMRSIGPTPNRRADTWTVTFKMKDDA